MVSGFPKPSPIRWFERVSAATSFYADFRPLFRQIGRWCTGIPFGLRSGEMKLHHVLKFLIHKISSLVERTLFIAKRSIWIALV